MLLTTTLMYLSRRETFSSSSAFGSGSSSHKFTDIVSLFWAVALRWLRSESKLNESSMLGLWMTAVKLSSCSESTGRVLTVGQSFISSLNSLKKFLKEELLLISWWDLEVREVGGYVILELFESFRSFGGFVCLLFSFDVFLKKRVQSRLH